MKYIIKPVILAAILAISAVSAEKEPIEIVRQDSDILPDGSYESSYETANGIKAKEHGVLTGEGVEITGSFEYSDPDGKKYSINYIANENGYQPTGDHLPVPPEIPAYIQRAIEYAAAHPYQEEKGGKKQ